MQGRLNNRRVRWSGKFRTYLRFQVFKEKAEAAIELKGWQVDSKLVGRIQSFAKFEREREDIEWGVADAYRKIVHTSVISTIVAVYFYTLIRQSLNKDTVDVLENVAKFVIDRPIGAFLAFAIVLGFYFLTAIPIMQKKKDREFLMYLAWWKDSELE